MKQEPKPNQTNTARNIKVKETFLFAVVVKYHDNYNNSNNTERG